MTARHRNTAGLAVFAALGLFAAGGVQAAPSNEFMTPSGNIGCIYTPAGGSGVYSPSDGGPELSCDRMAPAYVRVELNAHGPAHTVATDERGCCGGAVLGYGASWKRGPFTCKAEKTALVCRRNDGHGFSLNKAAVHTW